MKRIQVVAVAIIAVFGIIALCPEVSFADKEKLKLKPVWETAKKEAETEFKKNNLGKLSGKVKFNKNFAKKIRFLQ